VDADERHLLLGIALDDLVRDAHERPPDVVRVEDDLGSVCHECPSWPHGAGKRELARFEEP
jgi:hypothetical protein